MTNIELKDCEFGRTVSYIPQHKEKIMKNAETGVISSLRSNLIYVKYTTGDTAALTDIKDLYV